MCNRQSIDGLTHPGCRTRYSIDGVFTALVYKGVVKKLLYTFKYQPFLTDLQTVLSDLFYESLIQKELFYNIVLSKNIVFVPIPLHPAKLRKRGYNQAELLATSLGKKFEREVILALRREKQTKPQFGLLKKDRQENIKGAFVISGKFADKIKDKQVILVDDLVTSGVTLVEAANVLKRAGARKVFAAVLAHGN